MFVFSKSSVGVDIADGSIEVVELSRHLGRFLVSRRNRVTLPAGIVERGRIVKKVELAGAVHEAFQTASPSPITKKDIIFGLPEGHVYTHVFRFPLPLSKITRAVVVKETRCSIPLSEDDVVFDYIIRRSTPAETEILIVASSRAFMTEWNHFFAENGFTVKTFDIETLATFRGLFKGNPASPVCVVDMGAATSLIAVFDASGLIYAHAVPIAGNAITDQIAASLKLSIKEAEKQKKEKGLSDSKSKLFLVIVKALEPLLQKIKISLGYIEGKTGKPVARVIFVGMSSKMKGLLDYFGSNLEVSVEEAPSSIGGSHVGAYIEALGLALRAWKDTDPKLTLPEVQRTSIIAATKKSFVNKFFSFKRPVAPQKPPTHIAEDIRFLERKKDPIQTQHKGLFWLLIVLVVFVIAGGGLWWFLNRQQAPSPVASVKTDIPNLNIQLFSLTFPVAIHESEYGEGRVSGRVLKEIYSTIEDYAEAVARSWSVVREELQPGEALFFEPINKLNESAGSISPFTLEWLAYSLDELDTLIRKEVDRTNELHIPYEVGPVHGIRAYKTENPGIVIFEVSVTLTLNELIAGLGEKIEVYGGIAETKNEQALDNEEKQFVLIKKTEMGWLNARTGPATTYTILKKVYPGERYPLLEERQDWVRIEVAEGQDAWVAVRYIELLE